MKKSATILDGISVLCKKNPTKNIVSICNVVTKIRKVKLNSNVIFYVHFDIVKLLIPETVSFSSS